MTCMGNCSVGFLSSGVQEQLLIYNIYIALYCIPTSAWHLVRLLNSTWFPPAYPISFKWIVRAQCHQHTDLFNRRIHFRLWLRCRFVCLHWFTGWFLIWGWSSRLYKVKTFQPQVKISVCGLPVQQASALLWCLPQHKVARNTAAHVWDGVTVKYNTAL